MDHRKSSINSSSSDGGQEKCDIEGAKDCSVSGHVNPSQPKLFHSPASSAHCSSSSETTTTTITTTTNNNNTEEHHSNTRENDRPPSPHADGTRSSSRKKEVCATIALTAFRLVLRHGTMIFLLGYFYSRRFDLDASSSSSSSPSSSSSLSTTSRSRWRALLQWLLPDGDDVQERAWRWGYPLASAALPASVFELGATATPHSSSSTPSTLSPPAPAPAPAPSSSSFFSWRRSDAPPPPHTAPSTTTTSSSDTSGSGVTDSGTPASSSSFRVFFFSSSPLLYFSSPSLVSAVLTFFSALPHASGYFPFSWFMSSEAFTGRSYYTLFSAKRLLTAMLHPLLHVNPSHLLANVVMGLIGQIEHDYVVQRWWRQHLREKENAGDPCRRWAGFNDSNCSSGVFSSMTGGSPAGSPTAATTAGAHPTVHTSAAAAPDVTLPGDPPPPPPPQRAISRSLRLSRTLRRIGVVRQVLDQQQRHGALISWSTCLRACCRCVAKELVIFYAGALVGGLGGEWTWYRGLCGQYWRLLLGGLLTTPENQRQPRSWYHPLRLLSALCHLLFPLVNAPSALVPPGTTQYVSSWVPSFLRDWFDRAAASSRGYVTPTSFAAKVAAQRWFEARVVEGRRACGASAGIACWLGWNVGRWLRHCYQWRQQAAAAVKALATAIHDQSRRHREQQRQQAQQTTPTSAASAPAGAGAGAGGAAPPQSSSLRMKTALPPLPLLSPSSSAAAATSPTNALPTPAGTTTAAAAGSPLLSPLLRPLRPPPPPPIASLLEGTLMLATTAAHFTYIYALAANPVDIDVYATATAVLPKPSPFGTSSLYWDSHSVASGWETLMTDDPNGLHEALYSSSSSSFSALGERLQAMGEGLQRWWGRWWMAALDRTAASAGVVLGMGEVDQHASTTAIRGRGKVVMMLLSSHAGHTGGFLVGVMMGLLVPESRRTQ